MTLRGLLVLCCAVLSRSVVSSSLRSHGLQPTRLLCPWDFSRQGYWSGLPFPSPGYLPDPGIEPGSPALTGRFFTTEPPGKPSLGHAAAAAAANSRQLCLTLCDPMDCSLPGSSVHGIFPGNNTVVDCHFLLQGIFPTQGLNPDFPHCRQTLYRLSYGFCQ